MEALGTLAAGIAHDFNNLLTLIGGNVALATPLVPSGPVRESLDEILHAHNRAADLVKRILTFSRPQDRVIKPIAIAPLVEEALHLARVTRARNLAARVDLPGDLPLVLADPVQLHQVLINLVTNATQAMQDQGGTLTIRGERVQVTDAAPRTAGLAPGPYLRLDVHDTGMGMGPDVRKRIFEPFFTTRGDTGTGLGLSVASGIVRDHGGAITVESAPGAGTTFSVYLPAVE
jgi:signal transduction histidine kinase